MVARDTSRKAAALQAEIHRWMEPAERLRVAIEMSEFARSLTRAGLKAQHPEYDEAQLDAAMLERLYGFRLPR
jgi:hypothetical protein